MGRRRLMGCLSQANSVGDGWHACKLTQRFKHGVQQETPFERLLSGELDERVINLRRRNRL